MAAGLGTRMRSSLPKHLHPLLGRRVVDWVIEAVRALEPERLVVVASPGAEDAYDDADVEVAVQPVPRGTGDAVAAARGALGDFDGDVLVLAGDSPLVTADLLRALRDEHDRQRTAATLLSFEPASPLPYGRILRGEDGYVRAIVEERDATPEQRGVRELNASVYVFRAAALWEALGGLGTENAQGEVYLTDTIARIAASGGKVAAVASPDAAAPVGVNTRADLAFAAATLRDRVNEAHMLGGVTIVDPRTTWIDADVQLEPDVVVHPFTVLAGRTRASAGAEIGPHVVAVDASIGANATVGPFCYLRPATSLEEGAKAGTFVELKNARIGRGTKVPHLSYIGDAEIGDGTNVAAGNITANVRHAPGPKQTTTIGRNVKTGIHNSFVAPVEIGDGAWIAPGSVITEDVPSESLAGFPPRQVTKEGYLRGKRND